MGPYLKVELPLTSCRGQYKTFWNFPKEDGPAGTFVLVLRPPELWKNQVVMFFVVLCYSIKERSLAEYQVSLKTWCPIFSPSYGH